MNIGKMYILMNFFITFLIFIIVLFLYVHIIDQYKKNEDLEIFELDFENNYQLQKTCNLKQPFVFDFRHIIDNLITFDVLNINKDKDVSLKDSNEYYKENATESIDSLLLSLSSCYKLIEADINSHYYSENNTDFIIENDLYKEYTEYDKYLMPNYTVQKKYDFSFGSKNCYTPLLYHTNYRKFICVNSGKISVKMTPFKSSKYLHAIHDYENYEFRSPVNVWSPQDNYSKDFEKLKFLEFDVNNGDVLYVPSYWWFSIRYESENTLVSTIVYNSPMNLVSNVQNISLYFLQQMNIHKKVMRNLKTNEQSEEIEETGVSEAVGITE